MTKTREIVDPVLYRNGRIYTVDPNRPWADAMLVRAGKIQAIGAETEMLRIEPAPAEIHDLRGHMVIPGLHDAHTHLLVSGLKFRFECRLRTDARAGEVVADLCDCPACRNGRLGSWVIGGETNPNVFGEGEYDRRFLDEAFPDRPVYLFDFSVHNAFVNSRALELAGISADTPDPRGGRIVRRPGTNEPTGELIERATWALRRVIPPYADDVYRDALTWAVAEANRFGITSVQEASANLIELELLNAMDREQTLSVHVATHLVWEEEAFSWMSCEQQEKLIARRREFASPHVRTDFVKCWLDGAPLPPHFTQVDVDPETNEVDEANLQISEADLTAMLARLDKEGVTMKIHCAGSGAVRIALNAIEAVRRLNGDAGPVHEIAHAAFIHPDDRGRFAKLRAVAEMSPAVWHMTNPEHDGLAAGFKFRTMQQNGAQITVGSDWIVVPEPNLFPALGGMLDRGEESVSLPAALEFMTLSGARAVGMDHRIGSLEPGKSADFAVLDRNLFEVAVSEVGGTTVLNTVFEGRVVHATPGAPLEARA